MGVFSYVHQQRTDAALADVLGRKLAKHYGLPDHGTETMAIDFAQYKVGGRCSAFFFQIHECLAKIRAWLFLSIPLCEKKSYV